ncbi:MAG: anti-sigma factor [Nitriliruptor sp.]
MAADIHTLTGAYAVNALPDDERRMFEAHLDACDACRQEVAELQATAARLGAASAMTPPAGLREAVLGQLGDVRQEAPTRTSTLPDRSRISPSRRWMTSMLAPAAAIVAIAVLGLAAIVANLNERMDQIETASTQMTDVMAAADAQVIDVETGGPETVRVVLSEARNEAVFLVDGMAAAPEGHNFVLWLIDDEGGAEPAGTLVVDERGRANRVLAGELATTAAIGVTVEPADQPVRQPTTDPVMVAELTTT